MFDRLSESFQSVYRRLSGQASISESNVKDALADVRTALLEADVSVDVADEFLKGVLDESVGRSVAKSLKPGEEMIGIIYHRLVEFLGGDPEAATKEISDLASEAASAAGFPLPKLAAPEGGIMKISPPPTIVMMCGLQGSGKTTTCGKLAAYLKKRGRSVMLAAADLQRPAAVEQLEIVGRQVQADLPGGAQVHVYSEPDKVAAYGKAVGVAVGVCQRALIAAQKQGVDTLILDTAGRLHVNDDLMAELQSVNRTLKPHHIFLVVDAMTGQDAVNSAKAFHQRLTVDGVILTKFDSDTRSGAAISVRQVTGAAIKFVGTGEKLDAIEEFHPPRIAQRILGMGDVLTLVEKARQEVTDDEAQRLQDKLAKGEMDMNDFLGQLKALRRMGPLKQLMGLIPGVGSALKNAQVDDKQLDKVEAMINSMTKKERAKPDLIDFSRRRRIASGSGTKDNDVGQLVKQFSQINKLSKSMSGLGMRDKIKAVQDMGPEGMGGLLPGVKGLPGLSGKGSSATPSIKSKFKKRR